MSAKRGKKYRLVEQEKVDGRLYWRIEALRKIPQHGVRKGDKGGLIEKEENLSQFGDAWVAYDGRVGGQERVCGNAIVNTRRGKKFKLVEPQVFDGRLYWRVEALRDIPRYGVHKGDKGGLIEKEENLSQFGDSWVGYFWKVGDNARVCGNAIVCEKAHVYGNTRIGGNAEVLGAVVCGDTRIGGNGMIGGNANDVAEIPF